MAKRFCKATVLEYLEQRIRSIEERYKFSTHNGWAQVQAKGEAVNRAYGEWDALRTIYRDIRDGYASL